eukprot:tig00000178_g12814.t1
MPTKRALIVGIKYIEWPRGTLNGCVNDANTWKEIITGTFGYAEENVKMIIEKPGFVQPTRANIMEGLSWLVSGAQPGDQLFFGYSGHGSQRADEGKDEVDGKDECLVPMDFQTEGYIRDDELNKLLVVQPPPGVRITVIFDCCHSGSGIDLDYTIMTAAGFSLATATAAKDPMLSAELQGKGVDLDEDGDGVRVGCCGRRHSKPRATAPPVGAEAAAGADAEPSIDTVVVAQVANMQAKAVGSKPFAPAAKPGAPAASPAVAAGALLLVPPSAPRSSSYPPAAMAKVAKKPGKASAFQGLPAPGALAVATINKQARPPVAQPTPADQKPRIVLYSACLDEQTSQDGLFGLKNNDYRYAGALTYAFKLALDCAKQAGTQQSHAVIFQALSDFMRQRKLAQRPILSASYDMEEEKEVFEI